MRTGHWIALLGTLVLMLVMSMDWYTTATGEEARRIESITEGASGAEAGEIDRRLNEDAQFVAEREEKNAAQADGLIDRFLLAVLVLTMLLALLTVFTRLVGAKPTAGIGPAGVGAMLATLGAVLVAYRIVQEPGLDQATQVKAGAPLALLPLAMIAVGLSSALRADFNDTEADAAKRAKRNYNRDPRRGGGRRTKPTR